MGISVSGTGVKWGNSRTSGTGIGLAHTIGASAASGVQSIKSTLNDTQSNALTVHEIVLGTSAVGHTGLKITASGNSASQRGVQVDMINGIGNGIESISNDNGSCFNARFTSNGNAARIGFGVTTDNSSNTRGIGVKINSTVTGSSPEFKAFTVNMSSGNNAAARTADIFEVIDARSKGGVQTYTDDFNLAYFKRSSTRTGGSLTSQGAVVKIENVATGTFVAETVKPLEIIQSAQSSGAPISITQNAVVSTNFKKILDLAGVTIWISDGTTPNGNLSGTTGDVCYNGPSGQPFYCTGTTNWTGM